MNTFNLESIKALGNKAALQAINLFALGETDKQSVATLKRSVAPRMASIAEKHSNPTGADVKRAVSLWGSSGALATMLLAINGEFSPKMLAERVFHYASKCDAQRSGNEYLALKAMPKLYHACAAIVASSFTIAKNSNKYLASQIVLFEALNVSQIDNRDVYALYTSNAARIAKLVENAEPEMREILTNAELYKSESTASTQRVTSANAAQVLGAFVNAGNERIIYADKNAPAYKALKAALFNAS